MPTLRSDLAGAVLLGVTCAALVVLGGQALLGADRVGIGVDDYIHSLRFDEWLNSGWYVPAYVLDGAEPEPDSPSTPYVYGAAFNALAHLANVVVGNEAMDEISRDGDAYAVRHIVIAVVGLGAVACVGAAVWALTRDRIASLWGSAALLAIPVWTGYSMFSIKDTPVAAGFTFVTAALVLALVWTGRREGPSLRRSATVAAMLAFGAYLAIGTRPAMWVPLCASLGAFAVLAAAVLRSGRETARSLVAPGIGFVIGFGVVMAIHPRTAADPIDWLIGAVSESSEAGREGVYTLTAGQLLSEFPPAWYLPAWTFAAVPVLVLGVVIVGGVILIRRLLRLRPEWRAGDRESMAVTGGMVLVALQLLLLPAAAILTGSATYTGLRQHLYVLPPIAILAGVGAASLLRKSAASEGRMRMARWAVPALLCLALIIPAVEQSRLYPYNYVYVNEVAGIGGVQDRWETEYQFVSAREAFHRVPEGVQPKCSPRMIPADGDPMRPVIQDCYASLPPYYEELGLDLTSQPGRDVLWVIGRPRAGNRPPGFCREDDNVTRPLRGEDIVMAYVLRCDPPSRDQRTRDSTEARASTTRGSSS